MAKAVLISIRPEWCQKIASGRKSMELRKTKPNLQTPFKCYIYCTNRKYEALWKYRGEYYYDRQFPNERPDRANGKVVGEFVCDGFLSHCEMANADIAEAQSLVKRERILEYAREKEVFGWHISNLVIYDKPKELSEFYKPCRSVDLYCESCAFWSENAERCGNAALKLWRPPQSWCYVEELRGVL